jgi:hypothetical protein
MSEIITMPTVWVVNAAGHAYERAQDTIGPAQFRYLTEGNVNPLRIDRLIGTLAQGIVRYTRADDYFLPSGTPMLVGSAFHLWLTFHGICKILQWNAKMRKYELSTVESENIDNLLEKALL